MKIKGPLLYFLFQMVILVLGKLKISLSQPSLVQYTT
jgi:hypothetical protein